MRSQPTEKAAETRTKTNPPSSLPPRGTVMQQQACAPLVVSAVSVQYFNSYGAFICFCLSQKKVANPPNGKIRMKNSNFSRNYRKFQIIKWTTNVCSPV